MLASSAFEPDRPLRVVVAGGGIAGLTLARLCIGAGMETVLLERRALHEMLSGPGGIFIQANAMSVYRARDRLLADQMYASGGRVLAGGFYSEAGAPLYVNRPRFVSREDLGICLKRSRLQELLLDGIPEGVVRTGVAVTDHEETGDGVLLTTSDGERIRADVLVGADGIHSRVRARLGGLEVLPPPVYAGFTCWRATFDGAQVPFEEGTSWGELWGRGARLGWFAIGGGRYAFYAFQNQPPGVREPEAQRIDTLRAVFARFAEPAPSILRALEVEAIHRDDIGDRPAPGMSWGSGHVTLIGDAAHPVQPNIGQGACQGIEDAFELVKALAHRGGESLPAALRNFEASRTPRVTRVFKVSRQVGQLGQTSSRSGALARNWIYRMTPTWLGDLQFKWLFDYEARWEA